ncbi:MULTISPECIES: hypothetical protein [unclassified Dyella]|uniref:hypothetical protein n=1 Tax=Dyella sp. ASV21 TaxID=2795114 RepID=UPI0018ECABC1|nr:MULTISPECIES: hypothetical protein [unclassified Dyella]
MTSEEMEVEQQEQPPVLSYKPERPRSRHLTTATQSLADFEQAAPRESMGFIEERLRRNLKRYRFRGEALEQELQRIVRGPEIKRLEDVVTGDIELYPFGWPKTKMKRLMKRIFHGRGRRMLLVYDKAWHLLPPMALSHEGT